MVRWLNQCHFGDVRDVLRRMIADGVKVNTIVTSPPYWGLRSYLPADHPDKSREIGSEPTLHEFLTTMVEVFDLCRQVLRDDGTVWVNMGDSYAGSGRGGNPTPGSSTLQGSQSSQLASMVKRSRNDVSSSQRHSAVTTKGGRGRDAVLKLKDLIGQPWRLALALQDAGWYLRQDIIWSKPNPMPESIRDRCTKAHEYIFLLSKSRRYYFDQDAIRESITETSKKRLSQNVAAQRGSDRILGKTNGTMKAVPTRGMRRVDVEGYGLTRGAGNPSCVHENGANKRSVWTVATTPYSGAHFATFPTKLIEPCILAGAPGGGVVLDPFFGSGTTGQVAQKLGRKFIGIELNETNLALQTERLCQPSFDFGVSLMREANSARQIDAGLFPV